MLFAALFNLDVKTIKGGSFVVGASSAKSEPVMPTRPMFGSLIFYSEPDDFSRFSIYRLLR
jgi:hypothetical protein